MRRAIAASSVHQHDFLSPVGRRCDGGLLGVGCGRRRDFWPKCGLKVGLFRILNRLYRATDTDAAGLILGWVTLIWGATPSCSGALSRFPPTQMEERQKKSKPNQVSTLLCHEVNQSCRLHQLIGTALTPGTGWEMCRARGCPGPARRAIP